MHRLLTSLGVGLAMGLLLASVSAKAQGSWASHLVGPRARAGLSSQEPEARVAAARVLGRRGEPRRAVRALLTQLETEEDLRVRDAIYEALARRGDPAAIEPLAARLADTDSAGERDDRAHALSAIGAIGGEAAVRILVEWLGMADVGDVAAAALVWIGPAAVPHLLRALRTPIASARAAWALGQIGDARATAPIVGRLRGALPAARIAMIDALAEIADDRGAPAVARYLEDADPNVVGATLRALSAIGSERQAEPVAALADRGTSEQRAAALDTLVVIAPRLAAPRVTLAIASGDAAPMARVRRAAIDAALRHPAPALIAALEMLVDDPDHSVAAAEALARVEGGQGLGALLAAASRGAGALDSALALGFRRHAGALSPPLRAAVRAHLLGAAPTARCLARATDPTLAAALTRDLADEDAATRAGAASCALLLGDEAASLTEPLAARLVEETDRAAFRAEALAALRLGAAVDPAAIDARWWDPATAPEALWLSAANLARAAPRTRARARRAMRRGLRAAEPRTRAGAALALAMAGERGAWRALLAALEDEHDAVRLACARALATLAVEEAAPAIEALGRVEREPEVRAALARAARAGSERPPAAHLRGDDVLFVRVSTAPGLEGDASQLAVDVMLGDGRWLRVPTLARGEVLVPDVPAGLAEVQVRLGH